MKAIVFLADGFEECEGLMVVDILRRAGVETIMASIMGRLLVDSSRHIKVMADVLAEDIDYKYADLVVLPGGRLGTENLGSSALVKSTVVQFAKTKMVAAICAAPSIFASLGLLKGKRATVHPDFKDVMHNAIVLDESVVVDGNIVTGQGLGATIPFALEIVRIISGKEIADGIKKAICYKDFI